MARVRITTVLRNRRIKKFDWLTDEITLRIIINKKEFATLLCTPRDLKELVVGYLYTRGSTNSLKDIKRIAIDKERCLAVVEIFPGMITKFTGNTSDITVRAQNIMDLMQQFQKSSSEFKKTGGVHSAALCDKDKILILKEDLGRHNAIDKVIGAGLLERIDFKDKIILTSGRVPSEILEKIKRCHIPIIVSVSAPTNQAVELAHRENITLIGFMRKTRMNIYSEEGRIK